LLIGAAFRPNVARHVLPEGLIGAPSMAKSLPRARINDVVP